MEPYSGFENDFSRHARVVKFGLGMQAVTIGFVIYGFASVLSYDNDANGLGAAAALYLIGTIGGFLLLISQLAFSVSLMKFGMYRKSFNLLSICGCVACLLPITGFFAIMMNMTDGTFKLVVALVIAIIIFSVRPVYYYLMRNEITARVNKKQAAHWKNLMFIDFVFIICGVATIGLLFHAGYSLKLHLEVLGIVTGIAFAARLIYEFICTAHTERKLFETHSHTRKEDFPIYVQN